MAHFKNDVVKRKRMKNISIELAQRNNRGGGTCMSLAKSSIEKLNLFPSVEHCSLPFNHQRETLINDTSREDYRINNSSQEQLYLDSRTNTYDHRTA